MHRESVRSSVVRARLADGQVPWSPLEIADALAAGVPPERIAWRLGRSVGWVRRHADLLSPTVRTLFVSGRIVSFTAYIGFARLPGPARRALLDGGGRITIARCTEAQVGQAEGGFDSEVGTFR